MGASATWDESEVTYVMLGEVDVPIGDTLTWGPGIVIKPANNSASIVVDGTLNANGNALAPIYVTSLNDSTVGGGTSSSSTPPAEGDWGQIDFNSSSTNSLINYAVIRYGTNANINISGSSPTISYSIISNSSQDGIQVQNSSAILTCNDIENNNALGLRNNTPASAFNAINQYWGSSTGPYHPTLNPSGAGNGVSDGVTFIPWMQSSCLTVPAVPTNVQASDGTYTTEVLISWPAVPGASYYQIYRADTQDGTKTLFGSPTNPSFDDTSAVTDTIYYYWVRACDQTGCSDFSTPDTGWRNMMPPSDVQATGGTYPDKVIVTWNSSGGSFTYFIYRSTDNSGNEILLGNTTQTTFVDLTSMPGIYYYYKVTVCLAQLCSDFSFSAKGWESLTSPTGVIATNGTLIGNVHLAWNPMTGISYYMVYRSSSEGGQPSLLGKPLTPSFDDNTSIPKIIYYYMVEACTIDLCGPQSSPVPGWAASYEYVFLPLTIK